MSVPQRQGLHPALVAAGRSDVGRVRTLNEDAWVSEPQRGLFAVIDGMGGESAGEVAAAITRSAILDRSDEDPLKLALNSANEQVVERGRRFSSEKGLGCVATVAQVRGYELEVAHVGDTRAYLASAAGCEQLTRDHTSVAEAQENLGLSEAQARRLPGQHQVTRDIGRVLHDDLAWIETSTVPFEPDDILLLCSDGLHDMVPHAEIVRFLSLARRQGQHPRELVESLVRLALERGGKDNITVVAVRREAESEGGGHGGTSIALIVLAVLLGARLGLDAFDWIVGEPSPPAPETRLTLGTGPWQLVVPDGTRLELARTSLVNPELALAVELGEGAVFVLADDDLDIGSIDAKGGSDCRLEVVGGRIALHRQADRPLVTGCQLYWDGAPVDPAGPVGIRVTDGAPDEVPPPVKDEGADP